MISARSLSQLFTSHTAQIILNEREECKFGENRVIFGNSMQPYLPECFTLTDCCCRMSFFCLSHLSLCFWICISVFWTGFIRKVYLTLMIQLLVTVGIICAFLYWWDTITRGHSCSKKKRRNVDRSTFIVICWHLIVSSPTITRQNKCIKSSLHKFKHALGPFSNHHRSVRWNKVVYSPPNVCACSSLKAPCVWYNGCGGRLRQ